MRRSDIGFTLTELLIVIVILGVLTGIVVFAVGAFSDRGEIAACKADMKTVESASEAYRAQAGNYASAIDDATHSATTLVGAGYLRSAPPTSTYTISYTALTGVVTGDINGNPATTDCSA